MLIGSIAAMSSRSFETINRLCRHSFNICSNLPKLLPLFSCSACDTWRERVHSVNFRYRSKLNRSTLSNKFQFQRQRRGYGGICIRVLFDPDRAIDSHSPPDADPGIRRSRRSKRALILETSMEPHTPENIVSSSSIVINKNNSKQKRARIILAE